MSYCCNQMKNGCEQGRLCPLREAAKRGFWPVKPEPPKPEKEPGTNFWLVVLLAFIAFTVLTAPYFDLPFAGR